jgi:glucose-6-phosphate 1-dehydrogenase
VTGIADALVVFGITGDLARRSTLPALYSLSQQGLLTCPVIGVGRRPVSDDELRQHATEAIQAAEDDVDDAALAEFLGRLQYVGGNAEESSMYERLRAVLADAALPVFYLATPPSMFDEIAEELAGAGLVGDTSRLVVEKPFGTDLASAQQLNAQLHRHFTEDQIFRIDHYLGKETVQNLLVLRFANGMFEPIWNRRYIDHVQITAAETVGVERRASYYEGAGALRDMVQNHLMQLLSLVAMEPPTEFTASSVRDRKMDALLAVQPIVGGDEPPAVVRAQYREGWVSGAEVPAYRAEPGVAPESRTETFVALRLQLDSWRWAGVPFYLRTGKRLPKRTTEIAIQFHRPPLQIFKRENSTPLPSDLLVINVQPDEGISLRFNAKIPGTRMQVAPVMMNFGYGTTFQGEVPEAYETLLLDAMLGDPTLFARHDFVEASWALITPINELWQTESAAPPTYEAGEWGPPEADALIAKDGRRWRTL